ncbi:MAG: hypothetical protein L0H73_04425 [Nitrococcus sp.]|nr:hypothetical protein [Nitrococcus sp.]
MATAPEKTDLDSAIDALASRLRQLHKSLIDAEAEQFARAFGRIDGPLHLLQLLTEHPYFGWLQCLSAFIADLDHFRERDESASAEEAGSLRTTVETMILPFPPGKPQFRKRYLELLQQAPEVTAAHGALRRALESLPKMSVASSAEELHERHVESEHYRHAVKPPDGGNNPQ